MGLCEARALLVAVSAVLLICEYSTPSESREKHIQYEHYYYGYCNSKQLFIRSVVHLDR